MLIVRRAARAVHHHAGSARTQGHAGQDGTPCPQRVQPCQHGIRKGAVIGLLPRRIGQQARLGDVGQQVIRIGAQGAHLRDIGGVKARIELSVVRHGGIHNGGGAGAADGGKYLPDIADLPGTAEVAGINAVKQNALALPVRQDGRHIIGQVAEGIAGKAAGMRGKHGGRQDAGLQSAGGQDRQGNGQGALTHAGNILDGQNTRIRHGKHLISVRGTSHAMRSVTHRRLPDFITPRAGHSDYTRFVGICKCPIHAFSVYPDT